MTQPNPNPRHPRYAVSPHPPHGARCAVCGQIVTGAHIRAVASDGRTVRIICPACASEAYTMARLTRERRGGGDT